MKYLKKVATRILSSILSFEQMLKHFAFTNDVSRNNLNLIKDINVFVYSLPKCATSTVQGAFENLGQKVFHVHTDESTFLNVSNGQLLRYRGWGMKKFIDYRLEKNDKDILVFSGFRDPVTWYISLAFELNQSPKDLHLNVDQKIKNANPWAMHSSEIQFNEIKESCNIDIFKQPFDKDKKVVVYNQGRIKLYLYRIDGLINLEQILQDDVNSNISFSAKRVNASPEYKLYRSQFKLDRKTLENIYNNKITKHFYSDIEIENLINKYAND